MTDSEKMDREVKRIKAEMMAITDKIENYTKTNEMLNELEGKLNDLGKRNRLMEGK